MFHLEPTPLSLNKIEKLNYFSVVVQRWAQVKRSPDAIEPEGIGLGTPGIGYNVGDFQRGKALFTNLTGYR